MTDQEYREYLGALAAKHLSTLWQHDLDVRVIHHDILRLQSLARFVKVASERCDNTTLLKEVSNAIEEDHSVNNVVAIMERIGVLAALDEAPEITFGNLQRSAVPVEDAEFLRGAGVDDPDAEITLLIQYVRLHLGGRRTTQDWRSDEKRATAPSDIAHQASSAFREATGEIENFVMQKHLRRNGRSLMAWGKYLGEP